MERTHCGGCGSTALRPFLDLGSTPLADAFPAAPGREPRYPLRVAVCASCWLVQLLDVVPDTELYGTDYGFYSSTSPSVRAYDIDFATWALDRYGEQAKRGVVEIACNDGSLLQHFARPGIPFVGVEPAAGPAKATAERGLNVINEPFSAALADRLLFQHGGPVGLVIAKNVAAHVADLPDFFTGIANLIGNDGVAVVEVQNLADLILGNQIDHFYHEHRYYFSADTLAIAARKSWLTVVDVIHTGAQGGSIRVTLRRHSTADDYVVDPRDPWLRGMGAYAGMQGRAEHLRARLVELLAAERRAGRTVAGYAASAKSTTLLNWCGIGPGQLAWVEDTTPHKIGRWTPGTHIPIVEPGDRPDTYLLLAWNYLGDVLRREARFTVTGGRWIVPIPAPVVM